MRVDPGENAMIREATEWNEWQASADKAVDFIKPPISPTADWQLLQVKNRDNSENSSSSAIRIGTKIEKWHRTFSKKAGSNWSAFPDEQLRSLLNEKGFKRFIETYLKNLRQ